MAIMVNNRSNPGKAFQASTNLCTIRSNLPPMNPEMPPIRVLMKILMVVTARPTSTEMRAPKISRLSRFPSRLVGTQRILGRWACKSVYQVYFVIWIGGYLTAEESHQDQ